MIMELAIMMQFWSFPYSLLSTSKFKDLLNQEMHHVSGGQAEFPADVVSAFNPVNNPRDGRKGSCDKTGIAHQKLGRCNSKITKTSTMHGELLIH